MLIRRNKYNINKKAADEALKNVFAACDVEPNDRPLEVIRVINVANNAVVKVGLRIAIALLIFILILPFVFKAAQKQAELHKTMECRVEVTSHYIDDAGYFTMHIEGVGIDYDNIYAKADDGHLVYPYDCDSKFGIIKFPLEDSSLNIYVPMTDGTTMHAVLSK